MELSIIITSYKNPELLKICIESVRKYFIPLKEQRYEIIVADSDTEESTAMMMREDFSDIIFIPSYKNAGFQFLVKKGYEASCGRYLLVLNGDIIVKNNSINKLLEFIKSHPKVGIAGPKLLNFNETLQYSCCRFYSPLTIVYRRTFLGNFPFAKKHLNRFLMKDFDHKSIKEVDWLMGSALMTSREAVERVGLMDERFTMYMEDVDWCRRFWEQNYKVIYFPEAEMYHYHGRGSANKNALLSLISNRLAWIHIASAIKYFWKHAGKNLPAHN